MLRDHAEGLAVAEDSANRCCLEAVPGPATLAAWGGKARRPAIGVAWAAWGARREERLSSAGPSFFFWSRVDSGAPRSTSW